MDPRLEPGRFWARVRGVLAEVPAERTQPPPQARVGAVLVLLEDTDAGPSVVLTRRRADLPSHPGQVSFAGGRLDDGETVEEAALREAEEEIGLDRDSVEVLGRGTRFFIPPSRFWVVPVVARWSAPHELDPNPWEVDEILHVPLAQLLERERWRHVPLSDRGSTWAWQLDDDLLWGATAVVMALLLGVVVEDWSQGLQPQDLPEDLAVRPWEQAPRFSPRVRLQGLPEVLQRDVPHVTRSQVEALLQVVEQAGVDPLLLAEHAGVAVRHAVRLLADGDLDGASVTVLAGGGGNGTVGLVAARLLAAAGAEVEVRLTGEPARPEQLGALDAAGAVVSRLDPDVHAPAAFVVDAMLGVGASAGLHGAVAQAVTWLRRHDVPVVAVDLPSGMLADQGLHGPCVTADLTVTLGAPKRGFLDAITHPYVGDLYVADVGVPPSWWRQVGVDPPAVFSRGPLVRLAADERATDAGTPDQGVIEPGGEPT